jgi:hypothetical protein
VRANTAAYQSCRDFLSGEYYGEYVLIYGGKIRGIYPSSSKASQAGDEAHACPCAVMRIVPTGQPLTDRTTIRRGSAPPLMRAA